MVASTPDVIVLIGITAANGLLWIDRWVHRRERKENALSYEQSGRASLQTQLDAVIADRTQWRESAEALRLERAAVLAKELAGIHDAIGTLGIKASDRGTRDQVILGQLELRLVKLEDRYEALERRSKSR